MLLKIKILVFLAFSFIKKTLSVKPKYKALNNANKNIEADKLIHDSLKEISDKLLNKLDITVNLLGKENLLPSDTPAIYVCNHQSAFDIPIFISNLGKPKPFLAKESISKVPILGFWLTAFHCVSVNRSNPRLAAKAFRELSNFVTSGNQVIIFPEGTRSKDKKIHEFKNGAFHIASLCKCPIVPMVIENASDIYEGNNKNLVKGVTVNLKILPSIDTSEFSKQDFKELPDKVYDLMIKNYCL